ncbi:type II toxin-antitoxin system VapC family toxin [Microlunatus parietis]|uniref:Ribonuclease VapC n=1 Tax=Microlunatus parietis TaxID=682979 RepID=A0A7Y9LCW3_9ACTN|nr:PIN domain-containing protein [Microlunatus parietis]NYE71341.1 hypothetical protein [Microlunatus parietis]
MTLLVDTSVWSLALRRDPPELGPEVDHLVRTLAGPDLIVTTGLILQELLQGVVRPRSRADILERFASMPVIQPDRDDHILAADLRNLCRRSGAQLGTVDAVIAYLCIRHDLTLLTTDRDFIHAARHCELRVWKP